MGDDNIRQMASDAIDLLEEAMNRNEMMTIKIKMVAIVKEMIIEVLGMVVGYRLEGMMRIKTEMVFIVEVTIVEVMIMVEGVAIAVVEDMGMGEEVYMEVVEASKLLGM